MSENQPKKLEDLLVQMNSNLKELITEVKSAQSPSTAPPTSSKPAHKHSSNVEFDCPDCQKEYDASVASAALKAKREKQKSMKHPKLCEDCGEILDGETESDCPSCHGHNY